MTRTTPDRKISAPARRRLAPWLAEAAQQARAQLREHAPELPAAFDQRGLGTDLDLVIAISDFAAGRFARLPDLMIEQLRAGDFERPRRQGEIETWCRARCSDSEGDELKRVLRRLRQAEFVRILWRDLLGLADLWETLTELSDFADAAVAIAIEAAGRSLQQRHGRLIDEHGETIQLRALAMGKLGGRELNFSSDIDLVFVYREEADSDGPRPLAAQDYLTRQARRAIAILDEVTADGFVFRTDVRLRPFGDSGALVVSLDALETYLTQHGRDWERYAYVKARMIGSQPHPDARLIDDVLRPFVYRRYIDFGVFASLRDMKRLIEAEVQRREMQQNIKLGPGGIREIEFVVQSLQLVRGGSVPALQQRSLNKALDALVAERQLSAREANELGNAYVFLRRLENRIQGLRDQQTHTVPASERDRARLALAMAVPDWPSLTRELDEHRRMVQEHFSATVFRTSGQAEASNASALDIWSADTDELDAQLRHCPGLASDIIEYREALNHKPLDEISRRRVQALLPLLITALLDSDDPRPRFARLCRVLDSIVRRSAYISLLIENPPARGRFVQLAGTSEFLAAELAEHPVLLDELLDNRLYDPSIGAVDLDEELSVRLERLASDDVEGRVEALARFHRVARFRVAVADFSGVLPLMKVSDQLTGIAERVVQTALATAWREAVQRYGAPQCVVDGQRRGAGFGVAAYGKLGGLELGYGSDLDIVFLHDSEGEWQQTNGPKELANDVFFNRLARRLVHFLSVQTSAGQLYEVDTRLRPSGRSGLLVASLAAFERYQREDAWTWEHQAMLRSRAIAGPAEIQTRFERIRQVTLTRYVRLDTLKFDVRKMRRRMRKELSKATAGEFDIKQDVGGLADIEFLVQFLVLSNAPQHPDLIRYSDNIRQLDALAAAHLLSADTVSDLQSIYLEYRACNHRCVLNGDPSIVDDTLFHEERQRVRGYWAEVFSAA